MRRMGKREKKDACSYELQVYSWDNEAMVFTRSFCSEEDQGHKLKLIRS